MRHRFKREPDTESDEDYLLVLVEIRDILLSLLALLTPTGATTAILSTQRTYKTTYAGTLKPDQEILMTQAVLTFTDASGKPIAPPTGDGSGLIVTFASDNPAVTVGTATGSGDKATATIAGSAAFNLSATVANASGAPLLDDDWVTPFVQPTPIAVAASTPVDQATTAVLSTE